MSYVDVSQREGESVGEARKRRRTALARGWKFACACTKCEAEKATLGSDAEDGEDVPRTDGSKMDTLVVRHLGVD